MPGTPGAASLTSEDADALIDRIANELQPVIANARRQVATRGTAEAIGFPGGGPRLDRLEVLLKTGCRRASLDSCRELGQILGFELSYLLDLSRIGAAGNAKAAVDRVLCESLQNVSSCYEAGNMFARSNSSAGVAYYTRACQFDVEQRASTGGSLDVALLGPACFCFS